MVAELPLAIDRHAEARIEFLYNESAFRYVSESMRSARRSSNINYTSASILVSYVGNDSAMNDA